MFVRATASRAHFTRPPHNTEHASAHDSAAAAAALGGHCYGNDGIIGAVDLLLLLVRTTQDARRLEWLIGGVIARETSAA